MRNFKNYRVWHQAMDLARSIYKLSILMPEDERYGLTSQMRRAAVSIPSNIAEGSGRESDRDFRRFIEISLSSAFELETQLLLANDLYSEVLDLSVQPVTTDLTNLQKALSALYQSLKNV